MPCRLRLNQNLAGRAVPGLDVHGSREGVAVLAQAEGGVGPAGPWSRPVREAEVDEHVVGAHALGTVASLEPGDELRGEVRQGALGEGRLVGERAVMRRRRR